MTPSEIDAVARALPGVTEAPTFGPETAVYKVRGKVFAILRPDSEPAVLTVKCEPGLALTLRDRYPAVAPGYHTDKKHWNTVTLDGSIPADELREMVEHAYQQVVAGLPRSARAGLTGES